MRWDIEYLNSVPEGQEEFFLREGIICQWLNVISQIGQSAKTSDMGIIIQGSAGLMLVVQTLRPLQCSQAERIHLLRGEFGEIWQPVA
ncbi:MAG: hypothetical protein VX653_02430, partial [Candidatus Thermoplasmatota archaeon]|nr:hypothetical protein [Candidatus Thermoplasmatota archaeon]